MNRRDSLVEKHAIFILDVHAACVSNVQLSNLFKSFRENLHKHVKTITNENASQLYGVSKMFLNCFQEDKNALEIKIHLICLHIREHREKN